MQDLRYALRALRSVVNTLLVRPLPFQGPARLVWIANKVDTEDNMSGRTVQVIPMVELRDRNQSFSIAIKTGCGMSDDTSLRYSKAWP